MKALLLAHANESSFLNKPDAEKRAIAATFGAYVEELNAAHVPLTTYRPQPSSAAKVVRIKDGETSVRDGGLGDPDEPLTGLYVIDVPDIETALSWAKRNPAARLGAIEVRPLPA